jgi:hypothetical protein
MDASTLAGCPDVGDQFLEDAHKFPWPKRNLTPALLPVADSRYPPATTFDSKEIEKAHFPSNQQCRQLVAVSPRHLEFAKHEVESFPDE